ncbi:hypothetical protein ACFFK0_08185 [Paenibacillus chartarius]|uniref:Uncharacterized protein n=1 Tax=Paenibacillus chartarius TaxID=747481 RepID=A0ABV6DII0_9BACL
MKDEKSKKQIYKQYFMGVIEELKRMGYSEADAEMIFNRYSDDIIDIWGFYLNTYDFAKEIDELHRAVQREFDPNNPDHIYIGHLRERIRKNEIMGNSLTFTINEEIMKRINQWDQCKAVDVSGAKFAFTFIPSSLGTYIIVRCDVCERELHISDDLE